jgi:hypothetical protein
MSAAGFRYFQFGLLVITAVSFAMLPSAGQAYTQEQEQACTSDAFRLCSSDIPNVDAVTACMVRKKAQLSPGCRAQFRSPAPVAAAGKPMNIAPVARTGKAVSAKPRKPKKPAKPTTT